MEEIVRIKIHKTTNGNATLCKEKGEKHWMWTRVNCTRCKSLRMGRKKEPPQICGHKEWKTIGEE